MSDRKESPLERKKDGPLVRKVKLAVSVFEDRRLPLLARLTFGELLLGCHNTKSGKCHPKAQTLGDRLGRDKSHILRAVRQLIKAGLVARRRRRGPSDYTFPGLADEWAKTPSLGERDRADAPTLETANSPAEGQAKTASLNQANFNKVELNRGNRRHVPSPPPSQAHRPPTNAAFELAEDIAKIAGLQNPSYQWPEKWLSAHQTTQRWLDAGLDPSVCKAAARAVMITKRDGPPHSIRYFEKAIERLNAELVAIARTQSPKAASQ